MAMSPKYIVQNLKPFTGNVDIVSTWVQNSFKVGRKSQHKSKYKPNKLQCILIGYRCLSDGTLNGATCQG